MVICLLTQNVNGYLFADAERYLQLLTNNAAQLPLTINSAQLPLTTNAAQLPLTTNAAQLQFTRLQGAN